MKLSHLLESAKLEGPGNLAQEILGLPVLAVTSDSRQVRGGSVFVAIRGTSGDGHDFIDEAIRAGAVLVVGEEPAAKRSRASGGRYLEVPDSRAALGELASAFHRHPSRGMRVIGVTGTSGKTTTTYLIESILRAAGGNPGVIGTVNFRYAGKVLDSTHTTPGPVELQSLLAAIREAGCDSVVMEVSSHALRQSRVAGVAFDAMVFTNLSPEHLDFHPDMEDYFRSKRILFTRLAEDSRAAGKKPVAAVNGEDAYGKRLIGELQGSDRWAEPLEFQVGDSVRSSMAGIVGTWDGITIESELIGSFNAANIAAAVKVARSLGISDDAIAKGVRDLQLVPGRLERVANTRGIHVLVDYAHKPDALEKVLKTLSSAKGQGRLITVFGCGGDRDRTKRPVMGRVACEISDRVYITSDNPRTEDPEGIIREIVAGTAGATNFEVQVDRKAAIEAAISGANRGDIVLIAGKGHEDYQIIRDPDTPPGSKRVIKIRFDDREIARECLGETP